MDPNTDLTYDDGARPWTVPREYAPRLFTLLEMEPAQLSRNQLDACLWEWLAFRGLFYDDGSGNHGFTFNRAFAEVFGGYYCIDDDIDQMDGSDFPLTGGLNDWQSVVTRVYNQWRLGRG